jgi:alkylhydroperoxidase family enzyme
MSQRIQYINYAAASTEAKAAYDKQAAHSGGYVTNMKKTLLRNLVSYEALMQWFPLQDEAQKFIGERGIAVFCYAISEQNDCLLCSVYFRRELKELGYDIDNLSFSDSELLLERFGRALAKDANGIKDELFSELKRVFSEEEIVVLTSFAALMIATNLINKALNIEIDDDLQIYAKKEKS